VRHAIALDGPPQCCDDPILIANVGPDRHAATL